MARDATVFPQAIGLASTWEPALVEELADARSRRRCARRARTRASARCSTSAATRAGAASRRPSARTPTSSRGWGSRSCAGSKATTCASGVVATAKHLVGYGASEGGRTGRLHRFRRGSSTTSTSIRSRPRFAPRVSSVMNAYNEVDGVPCAADRELLTTLLRDTWGFDGCVVSDYFAVRQLADYHRFAARRRRRRRADPRGRARRRAPEHRLLRHAAPRRGSLRRRRTRRRSTRPCDGCS